MIQGVSLLGATGSIGDSTLDVVARHPDRFRVVGLAAVSNCRKLADLCCRFEPPYAAMSDARAARALESALAAQGVATRVLAGPQGLEMIASLPEATTVLAAIVGAAGLESTLAAARAGKRVLLANKEALVMAGPLVMRAVREGGATLLPIDSEHNAIFQCLANAAPKGVRRIILTASGGPFRSVSLDKLEAVTPEQACAHPNWVMGRKISVDSATMMNKGLEVIEARWLFDVPPASIEVLIHPQSIVHSMVEYADGSVIAQMSNPDMRVPIAHALGYPERIASGAKPLDLAAIAQLSFERPDAARFPCLRLAYEALSAGGGAPAVLNAANEVAVEAFLGSRLRFNAIPHVIEETLAALGGRAATDLEAVLAADAEARSVALERVGRVSARAA